MSNNNGNIPEADSEHPQQYMKNNSLPAGWRKVQLKKNPKVIWYENEETQDRQWYPPGGKENIPLIYKKDPWYPSGWEEVSHRNNNAAPKAYWYEHNSGETAWELPEAVNNDNINDPEGRKIWTSGKTKNNTRKNNTKNNTNNVNDPEGRKIWTSGRSESTTNNFGRNSASEPGSLTPRSNALGNLQAQVNKLTKTLNTMESTLKQVGGRRGRGHTRRVRKMKKRKTRGRRN